MPPDNQMLPSVAGTEGETQSDGAGDVGSMLGGIAGTFLGPIGTMLGSGVGGMIGDSLFGSSGEQSKKFMDEAYAGTTPWERLGSSGGGAPGAVSGEKNMLRQQAIQNHMNQQTINNQKQLKERELSNTKQIAKDTNDTSEEVARINAARTGLFGLNVNPRGHDKPSTSVGGERPPVVNEITGDEKPPPKRNKWYDQSTRYIKKSFKSYFDRRDIH